jgi:hypothetical protein
MAGRVRYPETLYKKKILDTFAFKCVEEREIFSTENFFFLQCPPQRANRQLAVGIGATLSNGRNHVTSGFERDRVKATQMGSLRINQKFFYLVYDAVHHAV